MDEEGCIGWFLTIIVIVAVVIIVGQAAGWSTSGHDHAQTRSGVYCEQEESYMGQQVTICTDP